jgi:hypothetical protein
MTGMSLEAQQEGQLLGTIGTGIQQTENALRELPATIKERTKHVGVTVGQLNRLIATESEPIAQALKDLLTSRSLLQEQIAFRREETMFQQDQMDKQFNKLLASGMPSATIDPAFFSQMDQMSGLPEGTYNAIYRSNETANQQAAVEATFEAQGRMFDFLSKIPPGQSVEVAGQIYSSTQSPYEYQFHEIDKETGEPVHATSERGEDGRPPLHVVGVRPAPGIAQMRKAEVAEAAGPKEVKEPAVVQDKEQDDGKKPKSKKRLTEANAKGT